MTKPLQSCHASLGTCALALLLGLSLFACNRENPLYCDQRNACTDDVLDFCDVGNAFPASTLANECISRPAPDACNIAEPCSDSARKHCTDDSGGTCVACTKNIHCDGLLSCDPRTNECTPNTIILCEPGSEGDATCNDADEGLPYCGDDSICVACLNDEHCSSDVAAAICDQQAFSCRGCIDNGECTSRVCGEGICADEADIVYVDQTLGSDTVSCGDVDSPCATIGAGIGQVTGSRDTVLIAEGVYLERIVISNQSLNLRGEGRVVVQANLAESEQIVRVSGVSEVEIEGIEFGMLAAPSNADGVLCSTSTTTLTLRDVIVNEANDTGIVGDACTLEVLRSTIVASDGKGVEMTGGTLTMHGSSVQFNEAGGIEINGSNYSLVNNIVNDNGGTSSLFGGIRIEGTSLRSEELRFNTIAHNSRATGASTGSALRCELTGVVASSNIFMLDDSAASPLVSGCETEFSLFSTSESLPAGQGNLSGQALFVDPGARDFHLEDGSPGIDVAEPGTDIVVDVDGDARPQGDGPDMGADEAQ